MQLNRPEYVTVFDLTEDAPAFTRTSTDLTHKAMVHSHEGCQLFMVFHPNNDHVSRDVYYLNDDVLGIYLVMDSGQIILSSSTSTGIHTLERDYIRSRFVLHSILVGRYQFEQPVLEEFMMSGFEDFEDFAMAIAQDMYDAPDGPDQPE